MGTLMATYGSDATLEQVSAEAIDEIDLANLQHIGALYDGLDPVPTALIDRIQFGLTLNLLEAEIAELQHSGDLVGVRADVADAHTVTFTSANLTTMVTITPASADRVRIDGWIAPGAGVLVELRTQDDSLNTVADDDGRFVFESVERGLAQFVLRREPADVHRPVVTPSIQL
jgi:hypothetical protein